MPNVVKLSAKPARIVPPLRSDLMTVDDVCPQLLNRVLELRARAHGELCRVVSLLDLSVSNIRKISSQIANPAVRKIIENELVSVEAKLRLAKEKAVGL